MTLDPLQLQSQSGVFFGVLVNNDRVGRKSLLIKLNEPLHQFLRDAAAPLFDQLVCLFPRDIPVVLAERIVEQVPHASNRILNGIFQLEFVTFSKYNTLTRKIQDINLPGLIISQAGRLYDILNINGLEMSRNVQSGNTQNLKSMVIQRSFPKWSVAERRKTAAASD